MATTTEETFRAADLISTAGTASAGEKLVATLDSHYPPELRAALLYRENERLSIGEDAYSKLSELIGGDRVENATVRGGERYDDDAVVTFVALDAAGVSYKGCLPWPSFQADSQEGLFTQRSAEAETLAAQQEAEARAKAAAAGGADSNALLERIAALEAQAAETPEPVVVDAEPFDGYADAKADDIVAGLEEAPLVDAAAVLAFESKHKGRTTVVKAAQARIAALAAGS